FSFHGHTGVGKKHFSKIIARNIFIKGKKSKHVHVFISHHHFLHKEKGETYKTQLKQWIRGNVSSFPRSMFIFDEMDKMNPRLIDVIKPFLVHFSHVDGVSYREAIFIFLSNHGGNVINKVVLDSWGDGEEREQLQMNSRDMETNIFKDIYLPIPGGFWHSILIESHLMDHFIPFLPLESWHVRQCVLAEMAALNIIASDDLVDRVSRDLPYFPPEERICSVKACVKSDKNFLCQVYFDLPQAPQCTRLAPGETEEELGPEAPRRCQSLHVVQTVPSVRQSKRRRIRWPQAYKTAEKFDEEADKQQPKGMWRGGCGR
ncbi:torsin-1A-like, partial [Chanos chanos]|uniref:Torsin-1A-like n=1 Tax=Chanos chanos TaxID=29144 RepID=A0A6J2WIS9_CHACN